MGKEEMCEKLESMSREAIGNLLENGIQTSEVEVLYKLTKIHKMVEEENDMYRNYGNYNDYGREQYGRRGYDRKYRGHEHLDNMYSEYGRYEEGREQYNRGNYGAKDDTLRSLEYMLKSMVQFTNMLKQDATSQEEMELIRQYTRQISEM